MLGQRRIRDENDCGSIYYNIENDASDSVTGAGLFDTARAIASSVASKLTGKAAAKLATKALEKGAEKVGEKTGEKLGELLGEKLNSAYTKRTEEGKIKNRGDLIFKELQHEKPQPRPQPKKPPGETRSSKSSKVTRTISQQFDDLLNLF